MRTSSVARVVMASLGVSVVLTLGCGKPPSAPTSTSTPTTFSVLSMFPAEGLRVGGTVARIAGTGFQSGDTVTVDGSRVDATVLSAYTISLTMPAHAAGKVDVTVISALSQAQASVPGGYAYVVTTGPVISELLPNIGSTGGGTPITIRGTGFKLGLTLRVDGIVSTDHYLVNSTTIQLYTSGHAAGTVEVIVTNPDGQAGSGEFTYASPATFDLNGDWQGRADGIAWAEWPFVMTIRDNMVVSVSCGASSLTLDPPPIVANGAFSFAGSGGVFITGKFLSPIFADGAINTASCPGNNAYWSAEKK
ncbi:MAG TPA: IPT/TIG domain-containing protein [Vicinamibacterales bacterium]|nr:IPT/TIG domain-containing protein [Vicinamibacterales bacterium]